MKTVFTQFSKATLAYSFIFLALVVNKSYAQRDHVGSGTRGGGEVVNVDGQWRFRDMVDNTLYECLPAGNNFITGNTKFRELMASFRETNPYAEYIFSEEAKEIAVCFVNAPLRYLSTEDSCALYQTPRVPRELIGVRRSSDNVLLINRPLFNTFERRTEGMVDVGAFLVHEVSRSFIDYDCENNTNVRNFTGLILRNHMARLSPNRFNGEMQIFRVNLPSNNISYDLASDLQLVVQNNVSLSQKLESAIRIRQSGLALSERTLMAVEELLNEPALKLQVAILSNDIELVSIYARINGDINISVENMNALSFALSQNNIALYNVLKTHATDVIFKETLRQITRAQNENALVLFLQNTPSEIFVQNENLDLIVDFFSSKKNLTNSEALNYLLDENLLPATISSYEYAVRVNALEVAGRIAHEAHLGDEHINRQNQIGETIVTRAIQTGNIKAATLFITNNVFNHSITNLGGDTYLHMAVSYGRVEIVTLLKNRFPTLLTLRNRAGRTALELARRQNNRTIVNILN